MTLQERLRARKSGATNSATWGFIEDEAADALDAKDERIRELEGALRDILAAHANDNIRPKAFYIASEALK